MHGGGAPQVIRAAKLRLLMAADEAAGCLVAQIRNSKLSAQDRRAASIAIMDRAGLKPGDSLTISGPDGGPVQIETRELADVLRVRKFKRAETTVE
jgi:hypothetical protein